MDGWMDTPQTVMTTRAPAVLTNILLQNALNVNNTIKAGGSTERAQSKMSEWVTGWMDTPQTVMTTRAPPVLKKDSWRNTKTMTTLL